MPSLTVQSSLRMRNNIAIPVIGFGVWDSPRNLTTNSCLEALKTGYRHIDTAQGYGNEAEVGEAIKQSKLPRSQLFITSKILYPGKDHAPTLQSLLDSVSKIDGEHGYIDLMLIHNSAQGAEGVKLMWQAMEELYSQGKFKAIGVSNFGIANIDHMRRYAKIWPPMVDQIELHPWCQQREIVEYCDRNHILVEAYCPLVRNQKANDPSLLSIARKHKTTTQQVLVRYSLDKGWIPLPKSDKAERIAQNADVFDFSLDSEDLESLDNQAQEPALVKAVDNVAVE